MQSMIRALVCVLLLGLAPLSDFAGWYLEGFGALDFAHGFLIAIASALLLPWFVAGLIAMLIRGKVPLRIAAFFVALVLQPLLIFKCLPPGYTCSMMGLAHKIRREYPVDTLLTCADQLRQEQQDGTLKLVADDTGRYGSIYGNGVLVNDNELPVKLRERFTRVVIWHVPDGYGTQVRFGLDEHTEIICGQSEIGYSDQEVSRFDEYPLADGIYVYRFHR